MQAELEEQYFALQPHRYGGRLPKSIAELTDYLNCAADALEGMMEKRAGLPSEQAHQESANFAKCIRQILRRRRSAAFIAN
ncbi:MAG: hypothetical protein R3F37_08495 [Candidatus Competibacteraceae bacterium]